MRTPRFPGTHLWRGEWRTLLLAALAFLPLLVAPARAQAVHYGVVMDLPRASLDSVWSDDPHQVERAYCITNYSTGVYHVSRTPPVQDDTIFRVFSLKAADVNGAGPNSVDFECPSGVPELHTHTPSTCAGDDVKTCVAGGLNAWSCQPSRKDLEKLARRGDPFAVVQCDRRAFRFYYPSEYVPASAATLAARSSSKPNAVVPPILRPPKKTTP
ncbi:MAG TPA: hypothetical protein VFS44_02045 [Gemmatimonadaceae bacterium]|nr:hypothetical protein [Gemmatimonadaceae bacterium]